MRDLADYLRYKEGLGRLALRGESVECSGQPVNERENCAGTPSSWSILEGSRLGGRYAEEETENDFVDSMQPTSPHDNCQHFRMRETKYCVGYSGRQNWSAILIWSRIDAGASAVLYHRSSCQTLERSLSNVFPVETNSTADHVTREPRLFEQLLCLLDSRPPDECS